MAVVRFTCSIIKKGEVEATLKWSSGIPYINSTDSNFTSFKNKVTSLNLAKTWQDVDNGHFK